jgi:cytochrome c oxidase cbb3-type subunit IV
MSDIGLIRGLLTAVLFGAFIALWIWAWSKDRKPGFDAVSRLPLEEGERRTPAASANRRATTDDALLP